MCLNLWSVNRKPGYRRREKPVFARNLRRTRGRITLFRIVLLRFLSVVKFNVLGRLFKLVSVQWGRLMRRMNLVLARISVIMIVRLIFLFVRVIRVIFQLRLSMMKILLVLLTIRRTPVSGWAPTAA